ncbi:MAG: FHA domain-containing protein [Planctomycetia bacterium]|jgi:pSer/pThr/pTyr-binding forkhead associated (FHA) protein
MITKLIVASGKSAGRAISIKRSKLLIGRAEDCDVRPLSEDVSRRHCAVHVGPADVWVEDLGSRNGTFVNGVKIKEKTKVATGDLIRVGALELKVSCSAPTAAAGSEEDVSRWLMTDEEPAGMFDTTQSVRTAAVADPAADSSSFHAESPDASSGSGVTAGGAGSGISKSSGALAIDAVKESKSKPGMLPQQPKKGSDTSRDAAAEALKKFFGGR